MSLKGFHIFFIFLATLLSIGFATWSLMNQTAVPIGICSAVLALGLIVYGVWFVKKSKNIIT
ncbi:hypothetical protein ACXR0O_06140 [Verrucomicrobiota bacterium sgz303538]